jgi:hypothetical protein
MISSGPVASDHGPLADFNPACLAICGTLTAHRLAGRDLQGSSSLRKAAESPSDGPAGIFDFAEVRNLFEQPTPALLFDIEFR